MPNFSVISKNEVYQSIKNAPNARIQKKICADLCCCSIREIEEIVKEMESMGRWTKDEIDKLKELLGSELTYDEIAKQFNGRDAKHIANKVHDLKAKGLLPDKRKNLYSAQKKAAAESAGIQNDISKTPISETLGSLNDDKNEADPVFEDMEQYNEYLLRENTHLRSELEALRNEHTKIIRLLVDEYAKTAQLRVLAEAIGRAAQI